MCCFSLSLMVIIYSNFVTLDEMFIIIKNNIIIDKLIDNEIIFSCSSSISVENFQCDLELDQQS